MWPLLLALPTFVPTEPTPIDLMSFNIRYGTADDGAHHWRFRGERVRRLLERYPQDIIALQEALDFQIDELQSWMPAFTAIGVGRDDGVRSGEHCAILVRTDRFLIADAGTFWLSDTPEVVASRSWGNQIPRICTYARLIDRRDGRPFWLYNVHLDHQSQPARERSVRLLLERIQRSEPSLIVGDFNAGETNPAVRTLLTATGPGAPWVDTFRVVHSDRSSVGTFHPWTGDRNGNKIDYIFASDAWTTLNADILYPLVPGEFESDHYPVVARIQRRSEKTP